jgi:hypothetical protein
VFLRKTFAYGTILRIPKTEGYISAVTRLLKTILAATSAYSLQ